MRFEGNPYKPLTTYRYLRVTWLSLNYNQRVYKYLRSNNGSTIEEIYKGLGGSVPIGDIEHVVKVGVNDGFLRVESDKVYLKQVFDTPRKIPESGFWIYEKVRREAQQVTREGELPVNYLNPVVDNTVHRGQGFAGTCVGQTGAEMLDILHQMTLDDKPTPGDWANVQRNVIYDDRNPNTTWYDILLPMSYSAADIYETSRNIGHVTYPSGSYIDYAMLAAKTEGCCRDWQWYCSKDGKTKFYEPYPDIDPETGETAAETKKKHKIGAFARVTSLEGIKRAVYENGCVVAAFLVYANYEGGKHDGVFPAPKGGEIGSHAVLIVGWKGNTLIVLNSWWDEKWPKLNYISETYYLRAKQGFFTPLEPNLVKFAKSLYRHITFYVNLEADLYIDGDKIGTTKDGKIGAELEVGKRYTVKARCVSTGEIIETPFAVNEDTTQFRFVFYEKPDDGGDGGDDFDYDSIANRLIKKFQDLMDKLRRIFGGG